MSVMAVEMEAVQWKEDSLACNCCDCQAVSVWGGIFSLDRVEAIYLAHFVSANPEHVFELDIIFGPWGPGTSPDSRVLLALQYFPKRGGGNFEFIDAEGRLTDDRELCAKALVIKDFSNFGVNSVLWRLVAAVTENERLSSELRILDELSSAR